MTPWRLGLRARVIVSFGVGSLLLSLLLTAVTHSLTTSNLMERRVDFAQSTALETARSLNASLTPLTDPERFAGRMAAYVTPEGSQQGMLHNGDYYWVNDAIFSEMQIPEALTAAFASGQAAEMRFHNGQAAYFAVGYPLPRATADFDAVAFYIQATSLQDVEDTLDSLLATLLSASVVTTILGLGFGVYVASRLFSPLSEISTAAERITEGDLSIRLDEVDDPDLERIVGSFNDMTSTLEERILRDARFASDVSHELRSPLMTLTGSVAVLEKRRDEMPERAQVALDLLSADIRRFKVLVEDLLEISRFDVGAVVLETEEVLLTELVHHATLAASGGTRAIPIVHGLDAEDLIVDIDKRRIAQVIRNLSENADKYAGGLTQSRIERDGDGVRIELEDEGPGVPEDERELIFDRFARGSEGGRRGSGTGVGLGLSLVTEHLRLHRGTIHVTDRVDGLPGARFVVSLPGVVIDE